MPVLLCGIDEAGYGPMLGPLCVGSVMIRVEDWTPGDPAPDLWALLAKAVSRTPSRAKQPRKLAIADSKALKLPNSSVRRHPLYHLERGVFACLRCAGARPITDLELLEHLGVQLERSPWYDGAPISVPLGHSGGECAINANLLLKAMAGSGVSMARVACVAVGEGIFNDRVRRSGSKAAAELPAVGAHMQRAIDAAPAGEPIRIVCDRLGGRTHYANDLKRMLQPDEIRILEESPQRSRYAMTIDDRDVRVHFQPEAEQAHFPVALASMTAKLVRELAMMRFNRYWASRIPEIRPTAGYVQDARRWLEEAAGVISEEEREAMVRIA